MSFSKVDTCSNSQSNPNDATEAARGSIDQSKPLLYFALIGTLLNKRKGTVKSVPVN